jgi:hypothetical protein
MKKKDPAPAGPLRDSTLVFPVHEPKMERFGFISARLKLYSLRQHLSNFSLVSSNDPRGFNFEAFRKNMAGLKTICISGNEYEFACTGHGMYLVSADAGALREFSEKAPAVDMSKSSLVTDGTETIRIFRITSAEMEAVEAVAGMERARSGFPPTSADASVPLEDFKANLRACERLSGEEGFDMDAFIEGLSYVAVFNDVDERLHFAAIGSADATYAVYVNHNPSEHPENKLVFVGRSGSDSCYIYRIEVVG